MRFQVSVKGFILSDPKMRILAGKSKPPRQGVTNNGQMFQSKISSTTSHNSSNTLLCNLLNLLFFLGLFRLDFTGFCGLRTGLERVSVAAGAVLPTGSFRNIFNWLSGAPQLEQANSWRTLPVKTKTALVPQ
jgi:hypothetical protein